MKQDPSARGSQAATATAPAADVQAALHRAIQHHQHGRLGEAEALYRHILQAVPQHADALHLLGVIALQSGHAHDAAELIQRAIQIRPADNFHCNLGNALKALGRRSEAIASYRRALSINPNLPQALTNLANALLEQGEVEEAIACGQQAVALQPQSAEAHCNLGNALLRQSRPQEAVGCYRRALVLQPGLALVHSHLGDALCLTGQDDHAIQCYRQALATGLNSAELHAKLGRACHRHGHVAAAIESLVQALKLSDQPEFRDAFVQVIKTAHFQTPQADVRTLLMRALEELWTDPGELLTPATSLIEANPAIRAGIARARGSRAAGLGGTAPRTPHWWRHWPVTGCCSSCCAAMPSTASRLSAC